MDLVMLFFLVASLLTLPLSLVAKQAKPGSQITVMGVVYCDICSTNTFTRNSYFLPGEQTLTLPFFFPETYEDLSMQIKSCLFVWKYNIKKK